MTERPDGGDIASGFGDSTVEGPVSDERAERMLHGRGGDAAGASDARGDEAPGVDVEASDLEAGGQP